MRKLFFFFLLFPCCVFQAKEFCFFQPPENWLPAPPETLSLLVKVGFVEPKHFGFRSTLNLAEEDIDCSLDEYLEAVKTIHTTSRHNNWANLGSFQTKAGPAILSQIDTTTSWGPVRMLQLILVRNNKAYIVTAASAKNQFSQMLKIFKQSFSSLTITNDLLSAIGNVKKKEYLCTLQAAALKEPTGAALEQFQKEVLQNFKDLGAFWQALILSETIKMRNSALQTLIPSDHSSE